MARSEKRAGGIRGAKSEITKLRKENSNLKAQVDCEIAERLSAENQNSGLRGLSAETEKKVKVAAKEISRLRMLMREGSNENAILKKEVRVR